jgi:aflatoxin B1 aldehyde reductase
METKFFPTKNLPQLAPSLEVLSHKPADLRKAINTSLKELKCDKVDMWYLHAPDRSTPFVETLEEINKMYKEGLFNRWGISNYLSWEVASMCEICEAHGWVKPTVYQGVYNALFRSIEHELLPCLRKYGMSFYAFNPLAGGLLTDRYHREDTNDKHESGARYDSNRLQGKLYRVRYWNDAFFDALDLVREAAKKHNLTETECALRWMMHHSALKRENGDAVIIGASSTKHIEQNLLDFEKGPLPQDVVDAFEKGWALTRGITWKYFH